MKIQYHHFPSLISTNDYAKEHPALFEKEVLQVVFADLQSGGRGRYERKWHSPLGGLYASFCFILKRGESLDTLYLMVLSVAKILKNEGLVCRLKRPNDLLVNDQKIAGMLLEPIREGLILGVGLNVNQESDELSNVGQRAISLYEATGKKYEIKSILETLSGHFASALEKYQREGLMPFAAELSQL